MPSEETGSDEYESDSDAEYGKPRRARTQKLPSEETESDEYEPDSDAEYGKPRDLPVLAIITRDLFTARRGSVTPGEVERMYAALAREMQSIPTTVAMQHDREAQDDASFHENALDVMFC